MGRMCEDSCALPCWPERRHAHATMLLEDGFNPKIVSERLGHATIATTADAFSHVLPGLQEAALAVDRENVAEIMTGRLSSHSPARSPPPT